MHGTREQSLIWLYVDGDAQRINYKFYTDGYSTVYVGGFGG